MQKERCCRCNSKKRIKEFGLSKGKRKRTCLACCSKQVTAYYARSTAYRKACLARRQKLQEERQVWLFNYLKSHPCVVCGETDPLVLQFDHLRDKYLPVTSLTSQSLVKIIEEIKKCEVVCANDHSRRTAQRANTIRWRLSNGNLK